ncbi:MAG: RHS repeat-associated core domain-containing protein, partial [Actinobacteria bacterium]|nr:RHS repeat-associated core domain-containing protein [Actinomycetota bacterium]
TGAAITHVLDPFGVPLDTGVLPGDHGFVGGTQHLSGLTLLGARSYDPALGRFTTPDPVLDPGDPQQYAAYSYANNNPTTFADPTGLYCNGPDGLCRNPATGGWGPSTPPAPAPVLPAPPPPAPTHVVNHCNWTCRWISTPAGMGLQGVKTLIGSGVRNLGSGIHEVGNWFSDKVDTVANWVTYNREALNHLATDIAGILGGVLAIAGGGAMADAGIVVSSTGVLAVVGVPVAMLGTAVIAYGGTLVAASANDAGKQLGNLHNPPSGNSGNSATTPVTSKVGEDPFLAKAAAKAGSDQRVQAELDSLQSQLARGNMNPGIGTKSLAGTDVSYARGVNGARLFFRNVDGGIQIVGKASKANELSVISRLMKIYGQ